MAVEQEDLMPCPFCGSPATVVISIGLQVRCSECVCGTALYPSDEAGRNNGIAAWNTRTLPAPSVSDKPLMRDAAVGAWRSIDSAPQDGSWFIARGGGCERPMPMKWNDHVGAWECDAVMLEDWDDQAEGYSRPAEWLPIPEATTPTPVEEPAKGAVEDGYQAAFYLLAELLGIPAKPQSPQSVWINDMLPKLQELLATPSPANAVASVSDEQVEVVARAIHAEHMLELGPLRAWPWEEASKRFYERLALAALNGTKP